MSRRPTASEAARAPRRHRGLSIIELMVGIVVSLLVSLAAAGSAKLFTASQRQGVGVGASGTSVAGSLSAIKHDIALAGLGFFGESQFLCGRLNLSVGTRMLSNGAAFTPIKITRTSGKDEIAVIHASAISAGSNVRLIATSDGKTNAQLRSFVPLANPVPAGGETVLLAPAPNSVANPLCTVRSATANTPAQNGLNPLTLTFGALGVNNQLAFTTQPTYAADDRVTLLGGQLEASVYKVVGGNLVVDQPLNDVSGVVLARNVIAMRAEFGISADGVTDTLGSWTPATGNWANPTAAELSRIRAVRIGIITRSPNKEKAETPGNDATCTATTTDLKLFPVDAADKLTPTNADWKCYRYRTSVVVVPLRNLVLGM